MYAVRGALGGPEISPCKERGPCVIVPIELNGEPGDEMVMLVRDKKYTRFNSFRVSDKLRGWEHYGSIRYETYGQEVEAEKLAAALLEGRFETRRTQRRDLQVEGVWFLLDF